MKFTKELAKKVRPKNNLLIEKVGDYVWISDTYIAVKLNIYDYSQFREKYNSYKSTVDIPTDIKRVYKILERQEPVYKDYPIMEIVIDDYCDLEYRLNITDNVKAPLEGRGIRELQNDNIGAVFISRDYEFLLTNFKDCKLYTKGKLEPIHIIKNKELKAIIMPVRGVE